MGVAVKAVKASLASSLGVSHLPGSEFDRGTCRLFFVASVWWSHADSLW